MGIPSYLLLAAFAEMFCTVGHTSAADHVRTCDSISHERVGQGEAYKGTVRNETYRFQAVLLPGSTGWGGTPGAPFHGFIIFLNNGRTACIDFEVHVFVELFEDQPHPRALEGERRIQVGGKAGTLNIVRGAIEGTPFENQTVRLKRLRPGRRDDFTITFITPVPDKDETELLFEKFLSQLTFW
jgi:hypothetical protein